MDLRMRLDLLKGAKQIDQEVHETMNNIIDLFSDKWDIRLTEGNGQMMVTHLSMALMRVKNNEPVKQISKDVYEDVKESEFFNKASLILKDMEWILPVKLPESERKYMLVNNTLILENIDEGGL